MGRTTGWLAWGPVLCILAWWMHDLQFHWRSFPEYHFGWLVLVLAAFLVWDGWGGQPKQPVLGNLAFATALVLAGSPFVLASELYKNCIARTPASSFALSAGCTLFIAGLLFHKGGWPVVRHFSFPLLFLFVAVPLPKLAWNPIVFALQGFVTQVNVELLNLAGVPAFRQANVIQLPRCVVGVDEACSGVRSLQSSIMAALFIGHLVLRSKLAVAAFLGVGVFLAVIGNVFRSLFLSLTAHKSGIGALHQVHDAAGFGVLAFTVAGLAFAAWLVQRLETSFIAAPGLPKMEESPSSRN